MFTQIILSIINIFLEMSPYLLLGFFIAGILHIFFDREFIITHLGNNDLIAVMKASLFGVPLPLCSCGVIPTALSLRKSHASKGATISFLISTPQTGVDSIAVTYSLLGPIFALFRPIASFIMGITGGVLTNILTNNEKNNDLTKENNCNCHECEKKEKRKGSLKDSIKEIFNYAFVEFFDDISKHLVFGIILAGIISYLIPADFFTKYLNNEFLTFLIMIVAGIPLYICATASIPVAAALMLKGLSPGAAFVFLAVGPATNAATFTTISSIMGKKILAIYLSTIALSSVIAGCLLNFIYKYFEIDHLIQISSTHIHDHTSIFSAKGLSALIFLLLLIASFIRHLNKFLNKKIAKPS